MRKVQALILITSSLLVSSLAHAWYSKGDCEEHGGTWLEELGYCQLP